MVKGAEEIRPMTHTGALADGQVPKALGQTDPGADPWPERWVRLPRLPAHVCQQPPRSRVRLGRVLMRMVFGRLSAMLVLLLQTWLSDVHGYRFDMSFTAREGPGRRVHQKGSAWHTAQQKAPRMAAVIGPPLKADSAR